MRKKNLLFDFDGTLVDTGEGIIDSLCKTFDAMHFPRDAAGDLRRFIGPPLKAAFAEYCGFDAARAEEALATYRRFYSAGGLYLCHLYEGVTEMLQALRQGGYTLFVASSKPENFVKELLVHCGVSDYFTGVAGALLDNTRTAKHEVIDYVLQTFSLEAADCVMIGDKSHDLIGAARCHMGGIGVTWGYGTVEELTAEPHEALADTPAALCRYFMETE